jgi:hypothetical protein
MRGGGGWLLTAGLRGSEDSQPSAIAQVQQNKQPSHLPSVRDMQESSPPMLLGFGGLRWRPAADGGQRRWCAPPGQVVKKGGGSGGASAGGQVVVEVQQRSNAV